MEVQLEVTQRSGKNKGEAKRLRQAGSIPCIMYSLGKDPQKIAVSKQAFNSVLRKLSPGFLPTTVFALKDVQGNSHKAVVRDIQYEVTTYDVLHLDFQMLDDKHEVTVNVPVELKGQTECVGVKAGGFLRQPMRHLKVRCFPKDMPAHFELNVRDLEIGKMLRVRDISMSKSITPLAKETDTVVTLIKK